MGFTVEKFAYPPQDVSKAVQREKGEGLRIMIHSPFFCSLIEAPSIFAKHNGTRG